MEVESHWKEIKKLFNKSFSSSFHYSIATVDESGKPHVTPIGSIILGNPGCAIYFEQFTNKLQTNLKSCKYVSVLAVNSSKWFWLKSLILGHFSELPAIRLQGEVSAPREATKLEIKLWQKRVKSVGFTKGHKIIWQGMRTVREIKFYKVEPVSIGKMTESSSF